MGENKINTINLNDIFQDVKTDLIGNLLNETKDSKKCMWYLICALERRGDQEILELSGYTIPQRCQNKISETKISGKDFLIQ